MVVVALSCACTGAQIEDAAVSSMLVASETIRYAAAGSSARDQAGWNALVDWDAQPTLSSVWFPFDTGNKDFNNFLAVCGARPELTYQFVERSVTCEAGEEGYLLAAMDGPGYVSRIAFGWRHAGTLPLSAATTRKRSWQRCPRLRTQTGSTPALNW